MEETINQRLTKSVEFKKINEPNIYSKIGTSRQTWNNWKNQNRAIPLDKLVKILKLIPDLNARWLLTGEGSMLSNVVYDIDKENHEINNEEYNGNYYCTNCQEKDKFIEELKKDKEWLKQQLEGKKETGNGNYIQSPQDTNREKAS